MLWPVLMSCGWCNLESGRGMRVPGAEQETFVCVSAWLFRETEQPLAS
jgi:hypothetical protein